MQRTIPALFLAVIVPSLAHAAAPAAKSAKPVAAVQLPAAPAGFEFIDTSFENASPLWYDFTADGAIQVHLLYEQERSSPNRAAGHFHFQIQAQSGCKLALEFHNLENVWNGRPASLAKELKAAVISENGRDWKPVALEKLDGDRVRLAVRMPGPRLYVARLEPYRLSDLDRLLTAIGKDRLVGIAPIGRTAEGRVLEIVRVGRPDAPHHVFLRARAHPWESGGNWIVEGLIQRLLRGDAGAKKFLERYCLCVLPMANKDGVAAGHTRFNSQGKDLNRNWDKPADPKLAPENVAVEKWIEAMIAQGRRPGLAIDFHNDGHGQLSVSRPEVKAAEYERYVASMARLEKLLRQKTWFTEGSTGKNVRNPGSIGEGLLARYGVTGCIHELNANWIAGLNDYPSAAHWKQYGAQLAEVFYEFFAAP